MSDFVGLGVCVCVCAFSGTQSIQDMYNRRKLRFCQFLMSYMSCILMHLQGLIIMQERTFTIILYHLQWYARSLPISPSDDNVWVASFHGDTGITCWSPTGEKLKTVNYSIMTVL